MTEEINNISQIICSTEEYSDVCDICRDEILLYPTISGRTEYSQDEVEQITLKRIIDKLRAKEQECEELREYHNKCCEEFENEKKELLEKYNQLSRDFYSGKYCNVEKCKQLDQLKAENEKMKKQVCGLRPELKYIIDKTCSKYNIESKYYHEKIVEIINNLDKYEQTLTEIKFLVRELLKRTGQVVPYEIKQILQKISVVENE